MSTRTPSRADVIDAAMSLLRAFAVADYERFRAHFADEATLMLTNDPATLDSEQARARNDERWRRNHWRVLQSDSMNQFIHTFPGGAVFAHEVTIKALRGFDTVVLRYRESLSFRVDDDRLRVLHEHVSPIPDADAAEHDPTQTVGADQVSHAPTPPL